MQKITCGKHSKTNEIKAELRKYGNVVVNGGKKFSTSAYRPENRYHIRGDNLGLTSYT